MNILKKFIRMILFILFAVIILLIYVPEYIFKHLADLLNDLGELFTESTTKIIDFLEINNE